MKPDNVATALPLVPRASGVSSVPRSGGAVQRAVWIAGLFAVGMAVGGYMFLNGEQTAPIRYKTARVERGTVISTVTATGTINPVVSVQVSSQVPGTILSLQADFNSVVKAGAVLARIDPAPFEKRRDQAAANLEIAKANAAKARSDVAQRKRELERGQVLLQQQFISQNEVDLVRTAYEGAVALLSVTDAQVKQAEAFLDGAELDLKYTVIRSPVDGIVMARNVEVGQIVNAGPQIPSPFLIALDLTKIQVHTNVSESDIGGVTNGVKAAFTVDAYPRQVFQGRVHQVRNAPISLLNVVTYNVVVEVDNRDLRLRPGMTANVTIIAARKDQVLKVPNVALRFTLSKSERLNEQAPGPTSYRADSETKTLRAVVALGDQAGDSKTVWKLGPSDNPEQVPVRLGISDGTMTELVSGDLKDGDDLIIGMESPKGARKREKLPPGFAPPKEKTKKKDSA